MIDLQSLAADTYRSLAESLSSAPPSAWRTPSLCEDWEVRHVIAHVTMPVRLTPELFGIEMASAGGDFTVLSNSVASRDGELPSATLLDQLRSPALQAWQPPGGGAAGALSHAVIHSLDVTIALASAPAASPKAVRTLLDQLADRDGALFGLDLTGVRLEAADLGWCRGTGRLVEADGGELVALLSGRVLPDGRALPRVQAD
jgi:uncharacterized protein (TIGR03083 family)